MEIKSVPNLAFYISVIQIQGLIPQSTDQKKMGHNQALKLQFQWNSLVSHWLGLLLGMGLNLSLSKLYVSMGKAVLKKIIFGVMIIDRICHT